MEREYYYGVLFRGNLHRQKLGVIHLHTDIYGAKEKAGYDRRKLFGQVLTRDIDILKENYHVVICEA